MSLTIRILFVSAIIILISVGIWYATQPKYIREECTVKILGVKGELYEKMKRECRVLHVLDANGQEIETVINK